MLNINTFKQNQGVKNDIFTSKMLYDGSELIKEINLLVLVRKKKRFYTRRNRLVL